MIYLNQPFLTWLNIFRIVGAAGGTPTDLYLDSTRGPGNPWIVDYTEKKNRNSKITIILKKALANQMFIIKKQKQLSLT